MKDAPGKCPKCGQEDIHAPETKALLALAEKLLLDVGKAGPRGHACQECGAPLVECPKCKEVKPIPSGFGFKMVGAGTPIPQSWCRLCRRAGAPKKPTLRSV